MELKTGDYVTVDGKTARIETRWGQGKHSVYRLDDGREILDLDRAVESGAVTLEKRRTESRVIPTSKMVYGEDHED